MKALVVFSGGMDSTVALYFAKQRVDEIEAISFNYGSKHNDEEFKRAEKTAQKLGIKLKRIELPFINELFKSDLLKSGGEIPEGHYSQKNMQQTVVPFRNGIMLAIAAGYAESINAQYIVLGNHFGDHAVYPDCRDSFITPMKFAIREGTDNKIELYSPFVNINKTEIAKIGKNLNVDFTETYSCYKGGPVHCGLCSTCYERREAMFDAGIKDETQYLDKTDFLELRKKYEEKYKAEL